MELNCSYYRLKLLEYKFSSIHSTFNLKLTMKFVKKNNLNSPCKHFIVSKQIIYMVNCLSRRCNECYLVSFHLTIFSFFSTDFLDCVRVYAPRLI